MTRPDLTETNRQVEAALEIVRARIAPEDAEAFHTIETYVAVAQRILAKTNPSKIRSETTTVWIQSLMPEGTS